MAVPIKVIPPTPESREEIQQRLEQAQIKHAAAILDGYQLLQQLHDRGVLNILRATLGAGDTIVTKLADAANTEEAINAFRNVVSLSRILGSIDPEVLHRFADEVTRQKPQESDAPPPSLWKAIKLFAGKDSRRVLVGAAAFVQAFGKALGSAKPRA